MERTYIRKLKEARRAGLELMGCVDGRDDELWDDFMEEVENMDMHLEIAIKILEKERTDNVQV